MGMSMFKEWVRVFSGSPQHGNGGGGRAGRVWLMVLLISVNAASLLVADELPQAERVNAGQGNRLAQSEEYQIGLMVKAVAQAIKHPEKSESMQVLVQHGMDSRYYVMIRGWLFQELKGAESLMQAHKDAVIKAKFRLKVDFLKRAIRRIDLE